MTEIDAKKVIMMPKVFLGRKVVESRFLSNDLFNINVFKTFSKNVTKRLNKLRSTDTSGSANKNRLDGEISNDTYNERIVEREKRISVNRQDIFGDKIYGKELKEIIDKNILETDGGKSTDKFSENVADEIIDHLKETSFKKYSEIYGYREKELRETENNVREKIRRLADSYINSDMNQSDEKKFKQELDDYLVEQLPQDTIRKKEEELFEQEEKGELRKQNDKLRTIGRALPMLIMASKNPEKLELGNIETSVSDEIFEEIFNESGATEKFTKEDFCYLRDKATDEDGKKIELFDSFVVNSSIQEFEKRRKEMADYINTNNPTDIFTYIAPQKSNLVFTPREIVTKMLNILEDENPGIFSNPNLTFCDLHIKSGLYLAEIAKRLNKGLEKVIRDKDARIKHIFEKQLYGFTPSKVIESIATNYVYGDFNVSRENIKERDLVKEFKEGRKLDMKFDVIIGNPPYQEETKDTSDKPIYNYFMDQAYAICDKVCFITPARFLFNAGKTPKEWNKKMLNDEHLKVEYYEQDSSKIFETTDIKGGVAITYRDNNKVFGKIGVFTHFDELNSILRKVIEHNDFSSIDQICYGQNKFDLSSLYADYPEYKNVIGSDGKEKRLTSSIFTQLKEVFNSERTSSDEIKILGVINNKRLYRYISKKYIENHLNLNKFKVLLPGSNGSGAIGEVLSTPLVGYTQTFISFGAFDNQKEAENCLKYIKTKFARAMLGTLKITQSNKKDTWLNVPLQDFTNNSDIDWTKSINDIDKQLYKKYGLSDKEINFIEEKVKEMD